MHVPVLVTRQVFVKGVPALIVVLSGMVTSVTNDALFVQFGSFVGRGVSGVEVNGGGVSVATMVAVIVIDVCVSVDNCVSVTIIVALVGIGVCASVGICVSVLAEVDTAGEVVVCEAQLESNSAINKAIRNSLLIILASFAFRMRFHPRSI